MINGVTKSKLIEEIKSFLDLLLRYTEDGVQLENVVSYLLHASYLNFENKRYSRGFDILKDVSLDEINSISSEELAESIKQFLLKFLVIVTKTPWNDQDFKYLFHSYVTITTIWQYNRLKG